MSPKSAWRLRARRFLRVSPRFKLGSLPTERPHPATAGLSDWARHDVKRALAALKRIDLAALDSVRKRAGRLRPLSREIASTMGSGGRVFLCGCGATGRLSLSLEVFWRRLNPGTADRVVAFMAGGDTALIRAIEDFEDHPEYAERQLKELGFGGKDLLIACTEGGETPFVLGAARAAARTSARRPYLLYCNPDGTLKSLVKRSRTVIEDPRILKIPLPTGPMALSGSTRMQASTALMLGVGLALLDDSETGGILGRLDALRRFMRRLEPSFLAPFVKAEADVYLSGGRVLYETDDHGITLLTDTAERSPTFSLVPFENRLDRPVRPALSYLALPKALDSRRAWERLLLRPPRPLDWRRHPQTSARHLLGFDFSRRARTFRRERAGKRLRRFEIRKDRGGLAFRLGRLRRSIPLEGLPLLSEHLVLKMLLNMHSTLVMGRLGRYEANMMTWVKPSCNKLVDRAVRYVRTLMRLRGMKVPSYERAVLALFETMEGLKPGEPVVLRTLDKLSAAEGRPRSRPRPRSPTS